MSKVCMLAKERAAHASLRNRASTDPIRSDDTDKRVILAAKSQAAPATHTRGIMKVGEL